MLHNGLIVIGAFAAALIFATASFAQDQAKVKAGLTTWKTAGCPECHGPFANGEKENEDAPTGANLRDTRLDDAAVAETIRCGRPGAGMPRFSEDSYVTHGCYGQPPGAVPDDLYPAPRSLSAQEIEAVVAYLRARIIGKRAVTPQECAAYYEEQASSICDEAQK
jgi:hypothetical protein